MILFRLLLVRAINVVEDIVVGIWTVRKVMSVAASMMDPVEEMNRVEVRDVVEDMVKVRIVAEDTMVKAKDVVEDMVKAMSVVEVMVKVRDVVEVMVKVRDVVEDTIMVNTVVAAVEVMVITVVVAVEDTVVAAAEEWRPSSEVHNSKSWPSPTEHYKKTAIWCGTAYPSKVSSSNSSERS